MTTTTSRARTAAAPRRPEGALAVREPAATTAWKSRGACRTHHDPDLWYPEGQSSPFRWQIAEAKEICNTECPVRQTCLEWALEHRQDTGIWGGMSELERSALHGRRRPGGHASAVDGILTRRLPEFLQLQEQGLSPWGIAQALGTSVATVNRVIARLAQEQETAA
ncbi:WhiB family transcriptional regulator [Streptomyces scabiei]|uniref:WhiB family transcriptional regulator n=1 Tax=Streptomyces scabiei TaxID=1930 RepID=UPI0038F6BA35